MRERFVYFIRLENGEEFGVIAGHVQVKENTAFVRKTTHYDNRQNAMIIYGIVSVSVCPEDEIPPGNQVPIINVLGENKNENS